MKPFAYTAALWILTAGSAFADPIYAVNFTATITSGTASGFNPSISPNSLTQFADLTGLDVSGTLLFDLGQAPPPTVTNSGGLITTSILGTSLPVFVSANFAIDGLTVPAGYFAMPTTFNQPAIPTIAGSTVTTSQINQGLEFGSEATGTAQSVIASMNFMSNWNGAMSGGDDNDLDVLIDGGAPLFILPPAGSIPSTFGPANSGSGNFLFFLLSQDSTVTANFGITSYWEVAGNFAIDSASGGFVTPEPGSLMLAAVGLGLLVTIRSRHTERRSQDRP